MIIEEPSGLYSTVLLLGTAHGTFLAFLLLNADSSKHIALRLLSILTAAFTIDLLTNYLVVSGLALLFPRITLLESVAELLYGPLLYIYVLALTSESQWQLAGRRWLHFLPSLVGSLLLGVLYSQDESVVINMIYGNEGLAESLGVLWPARQFVDYLPNLLIGTYLVFGFLRLNKHSQRIRQHFSLIEHISLNWLRYLLIAISVLWVLHVISLMYGGQGPVERALNVAIVFMVYALGYMGLKQPIIFTQDDSQAMQVETPPQQNKLSSLGEPKPKYEKSALDFESSEALLNELRDLMESGRPYLNPKLTLTDLAQQMGVSNNYLSQVINQQASQNFFDFINSYRVENAKKALSDSSKSNLNVLAVAMDSGFNSKSAFYAAFKHHTSLTPTQYRQQAKS